MLLSRLSLWSLESAKRILLLLSEILAGIRFACRDSGTAPSLLIAGGSAMDASATLMSASGT